MHFWDGWGQFGKCPKKLENHLTATSRGFESHTLRHLGVEMYVSAPFLFDFAPILHRRVPERFRRMKVKIRTRLPVFCLSFCVLSVFDLVYGNIPSLPPLLNKASTNSCSSVSNSSTHSRSDLMSSARFHDEILFLFLLPFSITAFLIILPRMESFWKSVRQIWYTAHRLPPAKGEVCTLPVYIQPAVL